VNPGVIEIAYPTLLEFSPPVLRAYPKETVVAEKLEAVTALEMLNSRMKDFFDLWALSRMYSFDGPILLKAIKATFDHRGIVIEARPVGLEDEFASDRTKSTQWTAFLRRSMLSSVPARLDETIFGRQGVRRSTLVRRGNRQRVQSYVAGWRTVVDLKINSNYDMAQWTLKGVTHPHT
jgi:Nucleotidyl transferase AbiEii toxin, Type IV TA system